MRRTLVTLLSGCALLTMLTGCQSTVWSNEGETFYRLERHLNSWQALVQASVPEVHDAVLAGLDDLNMTPITVEVDKVSGLVDGMFADGMDYEIKYEAVAPKLTRVSIRCGLIGDKERATMLFRNIERNL